MTSRRYRPRQLAQDLRLAIDCLPAHTRMAMLEGVRSNEIIVGAYVDRSGGVCPMLAAQRCGGRTDFLTFARTWDRFTGARGRARRATERELGILVSHLQASLLADESVDFASAIADHRRLVSELGDVAGPTPRPGDPNRAPKLARRPGWAWMRPFRRLDDYERALQRVEAEHDASLSTSSATSERDSARA